MPLFQLTDDLVFPPARLATREGLLAVGGDLSAERLLLAYSQGIFPWFAEGDPVLWWSPDPRMVLFPESFHAAQSLRRLHRERRYRLTLDTAFAGVIAACANAPRPGQDGTWITREMEQAYIRLHKAGFAHSVECWEDERLVGGLYGVSLGLCFFGESMFSRAPNSSKLALWALCEQVRRWGFALIDCQVRTEHLATLGAREIPRKRFLALLEQALQTETLRGPWQFDADLWTATE
jgi:leucyl/phenylalanyl-tRNA--protein transferase